MGTQRNVSTYPGVVVAEAVEGQLEVEVLVDLRHGVMNVTLIIGVVFGIVALVEEAV